MVILILLVAIDRNKYSYGDALTGLGLAVQPTGTMASNIIGKIHGKTRSSGLWRPRQNETPSLSGTIVAAIVYAVDVVRGMDTIHS